MPEYLIDNLQIFTNNETYSIIDNGAVVISGEKIMDLGASPAMRKKYPGFKKSDGGGRLCMPGWINTHMHLYSTYARGLALRKAPARFLEILNELWWRLDKALDDQALYYSALVPAMTAVKSGVTAVIDHHSSPNAIDGSLDRIEDALRRTGLRAVLCYEVSDRDGPEKTKMALAENERYIKKCRKEREGIYDAAIGLHAAFTLSGKTLEQAAALGASLQKGFHIHLAEGKDDDAMPEYGISTTERLRQFGITGGQTITAHAVHISEKDMDILNETETMVVHNPQSNMNNAVGRASVFKMLQKGILTGLGTDGMSAALMPEIRSAALIHKHHLGNPAAGWQEIREIALRNNPRIYERMSGQKPGRIEKGAPADIILLDYFPPTPLTASNIWGHILFGIADAVVDTTIINGKIVMKDKKLLNIDELEIAARSREAAAKVWNNF